MLKPSQGNTSPNNGKSKSTQKASGSLGNKNISITKGKGKPKEKAKEAINVLSIVDIPELIVTSKEEINFSWHVSGERVE